MIEICENWNELIDWCYKNGICVESDTIIIDLSDTNCDLPFKIIKFTKWGIYFDDVLTFSLSSKYCHYMIQSLLNINH